VVMQGLVKINEPSPSCSCQSSGRGWAGMGASARTGVESGAWAGTDPLVAARGDGCECLPGRSPAAGRSDCPRLLRRGWGGAAGSASFAAGGEERRLGGRRRGGAVLGRPQEGRS
jgi:hypothetical protein